ncbi:PorP/SprF family type IX secretion system membrane protein [Fulvivirgaceae bacterium BMA12]|uniref:PorP/SprF family type IX secretion system membrane protein n=1 Tax=Agaribacillus aureus TaxID=3051825 RepID=A0ABT8L4V3_9BACT|nr:PorP/SprF family type IX secretion system membrane protein [Fulvivirgaceae bacterium BMA12]
MKKPLFSLLLLLLSHLVLGQNNVFIGQYFKIMPAFAPGLTGANNFLDIKTGARNQWADVEEAPKTQFFSANGTIRPGGNAYKHNSHQVNDPSPYVEKPVKIGLGGYVINDQVGGFKQTEGLISTAVHVNIHKDINLSLGVSGGLNHTRLDVDYLTVRDPNDQTYNDYLASGFQRNSLKLLFGLSAYSDQFYFSYALMNLYPSRDDRAVHDRQIAHHIIGGYSYALDSQFEVIPNFHARKTDQQKLLLDMGTRIRYQRNAYIGISYRTNQYFVSMLGFTVNDLLDLGYSFEWAAANSSLPNLGGHEIVLGLRLFNHGKYVPMW